MKEDKIKLWAWDSLSGEWYSYHINSVTMDDSPEEIDRKFCEFTGEDVDQEIGRYAWEIADSVETDLVKVMIFKSLSDTSIFVVSPVVDTEEEAEEMVREAFPETHECYLKNK